MALVRGRKTMRTPYREFGSFVIPDSGLAPSQAVYDRVQNQAASYKVTGRPESALRFEPSQG
jgi:hypothetical protein